MDYVIPFEWILLRDKTEHRFLADLHLIYKAGGGTLFPLVVQMQRAKKLLTTNLAKLINPVSQPAELL